MFSTIGYFICIPFAALLRLFYTLTESYGLSLILFTVSIKLILLPLQMKSKKSMIRMSRMSGQISEIQSRHANDRMKMNEEVQKFYAEEGVNPMGGCLWSFLPMPILLALYYVIREPIVYFMNFGGKEAGQAVVASAKEVIAAGGVSLSGDLAYEQIEIINVINTQFPDFVASNPNWISLDYSFLGIDLSLVPAEHFSALMSGFTMGLLGLMLIPILSGFLSFVLSKISMASQGGANAQQANMKMMIYMMPLMSIYIGFILPAALGVYWIAQSGISIIQEYFMGKFYTKKLQAEEDIRAAERAKERKKRMDEGRRRQEEQKKQSQGKAPVSKKKAVAQPSRPKGPSTTEEGRVADRPYARGRSYNADHHDQTK